MLVSHFPKPFLHRSAYNRCHSGLTGRSCVITYSLFGSNSNCKVIVNGSMRSVTRVITESYSRTQAKDDSIEFSFRCFDEQHHSNALKPKSPALSGLTSVRVCPAGVFLRHSRDRCFERVEVGLRSKLHFLLTVALEQCKRSFAVDTLKSMLQTRQGKVVNCKLTKSR